MNIYLIGMMGSGKSTVGKILGKKMGMPFLDLDHYIEVKSNKSISEIFKNDGESHFRELESEALTHIEKSNVVAACGGGIILSKENRDKLKSTGKVVLLQASIPEIAKRLQDAIDRPLLQDKERIQELTKIWNGRKDYYQNTAHITVDANGQTPEKISEQILKQVHS
ncbi:MAG: shikimate kinase [Candidatus Marinimicrobia bacterium]|jgi:shikimate kinase|nr:shikimate kinase [Candidatus Neomarinimicrobiota bacterium]MDP6611534.1 shikimate kinase [Candidatus Neomarinimicrobiota bacterium]|tara:strand:+ start:336 stop:836 length:501 start_codon:yes stop_codon:yes gene_type:complete